MNVTCIPFDAPIQKNHARCWRCGTETWGVLMKFSDHPPAWYVVELKDMGFFEHKCRHEAVYEPHVNAVSA